MNKNPQETAIRTYGVTKVKVQAVTHFDYQIKQSNEYLSKKDNIAARFHLAQAQLCIMEIVN